MRVLFRIFVWIVCALLICDVRDGYCEDVDGADDVENEGLRDEKAELAKAGGISGGARRTTTQASANATRDSQLLSLLAARRRQLLNGRLATHINTLASLAHKNKINTTFAQLEVRDSNNSVVKRITFENSSNEAIAPTLRIVTTDGNKEIRQDVKPHEIRHLFIPKVYHDNKSRAGFLNNRRKNVNDNITESNGALYVPPEKLEGLDKEIELDPDEEFQVDESNHGLFLLNYSDTENVTRNEDVLDTSQTNTKETTTAPVENVTSTTVASTESPSTETPKKEKVELTKVEQNRTLSDEVKSTKLVKVNTEKEQNNKTLFMTDELYNHFHPLEELPLEEMAPFMNFGQKIGGPIISDNLTNSPSLSASTKSANFIISPPERKKFNSRYSATEKYKNSSVDEEEVNEDMDVSVVKNIIEKNKVRNSVKGPAPSRNVGLVNAYRKQTTTPTSKPPSISELNVTEAIINVTPSSIDKIKESNQTNTTATNLSHMPINVEETTKTPNKSNTTVTTPRNYTRTYTSLRRRPSRLSSSSTEIPLAATTNTTTEKASTLVYTAVVTSVSITSSMKGQNKTDASLKDGDNSTNVENAEPNQIKEVSSIPPNVTETTPVPTPSSYRSYKHRIRIRTTTTDTPLNPSPYYSQKATDLPVASELSTRNSDLKYDAATAARISERLANLYKMPVDNTTGTGRPKNILRRRRPTTTSTTTSTTVTSTTTEQTTVAKSERPTLPYTLPTSPDSIPTTEVEVTENTFAPIIVTSRTSSKSSSKPLFVPSNSSLYNAVVMNTTTNNFTVTKDNPEADNREEVVIEAEKTYTASYVLAGLGFLPVAAIVAFVLRSFLNKKTKEIDTEYEGYFDDRDIKKESPITPVARPPIAPPTKLDQKWEFPRTKLRQQTLLGQGNFGQVWKAEADDLTGHDGLTRLVAVKSIKETASQKEKQELLHEIYIMQKIGTHTNVVTLLACCTEQEPYLLIMEYVMCGKLLTYLRERRSRPDRFSGSGALTSRDLTVFAYCVARGMDYIASKGIIHRDLAARNVLVDHNKLCKIADFGMSREITGNEDKARSRSALPVRWMAPEALLYNVYNHETDVWAFGILLWEIVTLGSTPYAAMSGREVLSAVTEGYRLERPPHCKPQLYRAMHSCWHADPTQRPTFASLKSQLAELLKNEPAEGNYVDLDSFYQESSVYSDPSAIIHDDDGLSAEYDQERRCFRELVSGQKKYDNRAFSFRDEDLRNQFGIGTPRMGGFGIRDVPFNERNFSDSDFSDRPFADKNFNERTFDSHFVERKDGKLSTSSFHRERERENPLVSRNSFSGFPRLGTRDNHFQILSEGRNKRVSEFECDI